VQKVHIIARNFEGAVVSCLSPVVWAQLSVVNLTTLTIIFTTPVRSWDLRGRRGKQRGVVFDLAGDTANSKSSVPPQAGRGFFCSLQTETDADAGLRLAHRQLSVPGKQATGIRDDLTRKSHDDALLWGQEATSM